MLFKYREAATYAKQKENKRQPVTARSYCFIVDYCSKKAMLYKMQRGK